MADIIKFDGRRRDLAYPSNITKIVDGQEIECVDVDALTPVQQSRYWRDRRTEDQPEVLPLTRP
jgi:hypothetical protein